MLPALIAGATTLQAEQAAVFYVYDVLNRLTAVVDRDGNAATYTYDAVGNILRIDRFDVSDQAGPVAISMFTPAAGPPGTSVQVFGRGFGSATTDNLLFFNGAVASVTSAAPNRIVATVPSGASTGPISVRSPRGAAASGKAFRVLGGLAVAPEATSVRIGGHAGFVASEAGTPLTAVRWSVNGITGGDSSIGSISEDGVYTAPLTIPVPPAVSVTATHRDDASLTASALVTIVPALTVVIASRTVSVGAAAAPAVVDRSLTARASLQVEPARSTLTTAAPVVVATSTAPSVALAVASAVSIATEPLLLALEPSTGAAGAPTFMLRLTGRGLAGATSLSVLRSNVIDPAFTVASLSVNAEGTEASASVSIGASALPGGRVIRISTPTGTSTAAGTGGNVFTVQ
jgi:YD repeat-containing protein